MRNDIPRGKRTSRRFARGASGQIGAARRIHLRRATLLITALVAVLLPQSAQALPTPDMVANVIGVMPMLLGGLAAAAAALMLKLRRVVGHRVGDILLGVIAGAAVASVLMATVVGTVPGQGERARRVRDLAVYLRCDFSAHAFLTTTWLGPGRGLAAWQRLGNFERISMREVPALLERQHAGALIASYRYAFQYESGIPAVFVDGIFMPFQHLRHEELPAYLARTTARDLYLVGFEIDRRDPSAFPHLQNVFTKFDHVYLVGDVRTEDRYVKDGDMWRPANAEHTIQWPVPHRTKILDEGRIRFPGITKLLDDVEVAHQLAKPYLYLVAPMDSRFRSEDTYVDEYLAPLLQDIVPKPRLARLPWRLLLLDINAPDIRDRLDSAAREIDGMPFMIIGLTKYDYAYQGLDVAFGLWERLRHDPSRYRLVGFAPRLPEAVAEYRIAASELGMIDLVRTWLQPALASLQRLTGLGGGGTVILLALLLRLAILPIGLAETRSRVIRLRLRALADAPHPPAWAGSLPRLLERIGASGRWEMLGAAVTFVLYLPAAALRTGFPGLAADSFLWIDQLGHADVALAILVAALLFMKLWTGGSGRTGWVVLLTALLAVALQWVPALILLYVGAVLAVTLVQDLMVEWNTRRVLRHILLLGVPA